MKNKILKWQQKNVAYADYIDKDLVYHLYCNYRGITREIYMNDGMCGLVRANIWDRCAFSGYHPKIKSWIKPTRKDLTWYDCTLKSIPCVAIERSFTNKKTMIKAVPQLKYVYPDYWDRWNLFEFVSTLKRYPQLEMIYKNDYLKPYWHCKTLYKLNKKDLFNLAKFIEVDPRVKLSEGNLLELIYLLKHPNVKTKEQWDNIRWLKRTKKVSKEFLGEHKDLARYLKKQYNTNNHDDSYNRITKDNMVREYNDYLDLCNKLGINSYDAMYPRDLMKTISTLSKKVKRIEQDKPLIKTKKYKKYSDAVNKIQDKCKKITLSIPNSERELIKAGNKLSNCVGSGSYAEYVRNGESLIVLANVDNKPVECCQIDLEEMKIAQLYGKKNSSNGEYHAIARTQINRFIREIRA